MTDSHTKYKLLNLKDFSVNSDESLALSYQGTSQFSKSPSSDGSLASEDRFLSLHEELYNLSKEERDCILDIPAARTLEDLKLFTRWTTGLYTIT